MARVARMALDIALVTGKVMKPAVATMWNYAKVEMAPPMTVSLLNGSLGKSIEAVVGKFSDGFLNGLQNQIKSMDEAEILRKKAKEAAVKAAAEAEKAKKLLDEKKKAAVKAGKEVKKAVEKKVVEAKKSIEKKISKDEKKK